MSAKLRDLSFIFASLVLVACTVAACSESPASSSHSTGNRVLSTDIEPELLPTPTLAQPTAEDVLRPPTPIVLPSPTPADGGQATQPEATATPPADTVSSVQATEPVDDLPTDASAEYLVALGNAALAEGNYARAALAFERAVADGGALTARTLAEAKLSLGIALVQDGRNAEAIDVLAPIAEADNPPAGDRSRTSVQPVNVPDVAAFYLARAQSALGDHRAAIAAYERYVQANPDMAAYVQPLIADAYLALGESDAALAALERAVSGEAQRFRAVENRFRLAAAYLEREDYANAVAQYDSIHDIARTEVTKGHVTYLAGQAEIRAGNPDAAHERFLFAVNNYPRAPESYQALIALIDAGVPVDEYQRGIVDYYAAAYLPAVEAFRRHLEANPEGYQPDTRLFLARTYEALGNLEAALAELEQYAADDPAAALVERAEMLTRAGDLETALEVYTAYLANYAQADRAAAVAASAATLADRLGREDAAQRYLFLADTFPFDSQAPAALYRAGELQTAAGARAEGIQTWQRLAEQYPANEYGAEAVFRLLQLAREDGATELDVRQLEEQARALPRSNYFAIRARDLVDGVEPFVADGPMLLPEDAEAERALTEDWLRERLVGAGTELPDTTLGLLSADLAADTRLQIGEKLWQIGLFEAAKAELETLREAKAGDPLANYQLAIYFRDLGLYRSSIIAAAAVLRQMEATAFDAPLFLGRLSFPVYYSDLIIPLADRRRYDPRLQFALVRQESLFESFARSGAAAQGLSQVIPDTGAWIAQRLSWPNYENEELYKPYVGLNFGAYYLSEQLRNFDGHVHAALAAYNAGPGNAARWYGSAGNDFDRFVDTVDFAETRLYIERIYEGFAAYRHLYRGS